MLLALAAVPLAVAAAGAVRVVAYDAGGGDILVSDDAKTQARTGSGSVGQPYTFGIHFFTNTSDHEVRFIDVRPVDPTPGLVIDSIRAIHQCDPRNGGRRAGWIGLIAGTMNCPRFGDGREATRGWSCASAEEVSERAA